MLIVEVKRNPKKIDMGLLEEKAQKLLQKHKGYEVTFKGYSIEDMCKGDLF